MPKKHGIHKLIVIGLIAQTCIEATVRYAAELAYGVTMGVALDRLATVKSRLVESVRFFFENEPFKTNILEYIF